MRILFVSNLYEPFIVGGAEIILKDLVKGAQSFGHEVKVITFGPEESREEIVDNIPVYRAKIPNLYLPYGKVRPPFLKRALWHLFDIYNPLSKRIVLEQIEKFKPDVISIHNTPGWSSTIWDAVEEAKVPAIQVLHDLYFLCPKYMFKNDSICEKQCLSCKLVRYPYKLKSNKLTAVVGVSRFILNKLLEFGYFKNVPIKKVIYNSRDLSSFTFKRNVDARFVNFGFIGTLAPNKGIELLLKAYHKIKKPNYRLYVAGSGKEEYERYLKSRYAEESIVFMGRVKPEDFFEKVDVTIVPSRGYENFPGVIVESFAFGVPVIGSNIGGIPEMIVEGINGILFDPYKDGDLEEKMLSFEEELDSWRNKSGIIKQSSKKFLDYNGWLQKWKEVYRIVFNKQN